MLFTKLQFTKTTSTVSNLGTICPSLFLSITFFELPNNSLNVKPSNSQLNKLKSAIKNETDVVLRLSLNMIGNSDDKTNFPHELLLTNRQVANLCTAFAKHTSTDIKLSKAQLSKMIQSGGFLGRLSGPLIRTGLPLIQSVIKPLAESILVALGLAAAASAADAGINKKILGSGHNNTISIISNDEMEDILKIVRWLEDSGLLLKGVSETIRNDAKQRGGFLSMFVIRHIRSKFIRRYVI